MLARYCRFLIYMLAYMKNFLQFLLWKEERQKKRSLQVATTPQQLRHLYLQVGELSRYRTKFIVYHKFMHRSLLNAFLYSCILGSNISSLGTEFFKDVWDCLWRSQNTRRETICLSKFLGPYNPYHWCYDHDSWR